MAGAVDGTEGTIRRFSAASRVAHWALAIPFLMLLASGLLLFLPSVKAVHVGGYRLVPLIHILSGVLFALAAPVVWLAAPGRRWLRADLRRLLRVEALDRAWLRYAGYALLGAKLAAPPVGKFNAGQKLNTAAMLLLSFGLCLSGAVLGVNFFTKAVFASAFVERVFPLHDLFMLLALPLVAGHVYLATINPGTRPSLRGMFDGRVRRDWALAHHREWVRELPAPGDGQQASGTGSSAES
ncbi:MAG TPA: cytochrome b/b6 domain-containing protein [Dehalococcoidia bacterium]|nr:cytochrome b/b6 domain-containing protein [Dehalococcoidia bacterium]